MLILMVFQVARCAGEYRRKTGFWLEEGAAPYYVFRDAGAELTLVSPESGQPPVDPKSDLPENRTPAIARFKQDADAQEAVANPVKLDGARRKILMRFNPGGLGPTWALAESAESIALIGWFCTAGKPVAAVYHAPRRPAPGDVRGRAGREGQAGHGLRQ